MMNIEIIDNRIEMFGERASGCGCFTTRYSNKRVTMYLGTFGDIKYVMIEISANGMKITAEYEYTSETGSKILEEWKSLDRDDNKCIKPSKKFDKLLVSTVLEELVSSLTIPSLSKLLNKFYDSGVQEGQRQIKSDIKRLFQKILY